MVSLRPFMPRRPVTDRNGNILAVDRPVYTLYVHPKLFNHSYQEVAQLIAPILGRDAGELVKIFESKNSGILLTSNLSESIGDRLIGLNLNGLEFIQKYSRFYPEADLFSDVVDILILTVAVKQGWNIVMRNFWNVLCKHYASIAREWRTASRPRARRIFTY